MRDYQMSSVITFEQQEQLENILHKWANLHHNGKKVDAGIEIISDGYLEDAMGKQDMNQPCYAVFIHRDSLLKPFPKHDLAFGYVAHRLNEEACFYVWLDLKNNKPQEIAEPTNTSLDILSVYQIVFETERLRMLA